MKKVFVEPDMKKIELNLSENIATSKVLIKDGFYFTYDWWEYTVQFSGKKLTQGVSEDELWACYVDENTRIGRGTVVPEEIVRMNMKY